jgi:S-(hydroxymethyl)glutathione dehydrogenase/alcohol dehydrogenase
MAVKAVVIEEAGQPPIVDTIRLVKLQDDEIRVRMVASGICHTDLSVASGRIPSSFPAVLGHEGAGVVEEVGPAVRRFRPGDRAVVSVAHHCGHCRYCETGNAPLCVERDSSRARYFRADSALVQAFGTGTFAEEIVVRERSLVGVPGDVPLDVAAVTGCAAVTGIGAVLNVVKVRAGSTCVVVGCGGVGACVIMGARLAGAERIVAVDSNDRRREAVLACGATDFAPPDLDALRALEPEGFDYAFEAVGSEETLSLAFGATGLQGETAVVGLPGQSARLMFSAFDLVVGSRRVIGVNMGSYRPNVDFDSYFRLYRRGKLPLDALITEKRPLDDAPAAFELAAGGSGMRILLGPEDPGGGASQELR